MYGYEVYDADSVLLYDSGLQFDDKWDAEVDAGIAVDDIGPAVGYNLYYEEDI